MSGCFQAYLLINFLHLDLLYLIIIRHLIKWSGLFPSWHITFARLRLNANISTFTLEIFLKVV